MSVELTPEQPEEVARAIERVVAPPPRDPDPWWKSGLDENLEQPASDT